MEKGKSRTASGTDAVTRSKKGAPDLTGTASNGDTDSGADPVLEHLRLAGEEYKQLLSRRAADSRKLLEAESALARQQEETAELQRNLKATNARLEHAKTETDTLKSATVELEREVSSTQELLEQERNAARRYRDRANQLAGSIKQIHRALFDGGVYGLVLRACLAITGATRGLYITTRGGPETMRIRAAEAIDGYPDSRPSEYLIALCTRVLETNQSLVCNKEEELDDLPKPRRAGERFQNMLVAPVVLLKNLNGIIVAVDKISGDFNEEDVETLLSVGDQAAVAEENRQLQEALQDAYVGTMSMLADAVEAKDPYTYGHCDLVSKYARLTAEKLNLNEESKSIICYAALLHDVGKIGVSDGVLNKPGPLLPEERDLMRSHVRVGHDLLARVPALKKIAQVVLHHHEWYDGSGYPEGLQGDEIPMAARIVCCVDAYCAMITKRSYKEAYSVERARDELKRCSGTQFDPKVVNTFLAVLDELEGQDPDIEDEDATCDMLPSFIDVKQWRDQIH